MINPATSILAVILPLLVPIASAWGIAFYTGQNCNQDKYFSSAMYHDHSTSNSDCLAVGAPGENCKWYTNQGSNSSECTGPNPWTQSIFFSTGSICGIGFEDNNDCYFNEFDWAPQFCYRVSDLPDWAIRGQTLAFQCRDREGEDKIDGYIPMGGFNITV